MNETTDWGSALAILGAGLILGMMCLYFFTRKRTTPAPAKSSALHDLEARRDRLVEELRSEVSAEERTRLELETAQVLRLIDEQRQRPEGLDAPAAESAPAAIRRATTIGFFWGAGSMLALGGLAWLVSNAMTPRPPEGQQPMQTAGAAPQQPADPAVVQLEEAVRQSPDNLEARISLAQAYLERENLMGVFEQTQYVLTKSPSDARALTYQALVR